TADAQSRTYGDANPPLTFAIGGAGLVNGDTLAGALATNATTTSNVGNYGITQGTLAATANYAVNYIGANLSVTPRPLTITADNAAKNEGETVTFAGTEFQVTGLVNGDTVSSVTLTSAGAPASALAANSPFPILGNNPVGTGLGNYAIAFTTGNLTINPNPQQPPPLQQIVQQPINQNTTP